MILLESNIPFLKNHKHLAYTSKKREGIIHVFFCFRRYIVCGLGYPTFQDNSHRVVDDVSYYPQAHPRMGLLLRPLLLLVAPTAGSFPLLVNHKSAKRERERRRDVTILNSFILNNCTPRTCLLLLRVLLLSLNRISGGNGFLFRWWHELLVRE